MENWKPVPGFEGFYESSDIGRIRRILKNGYRILRPRNANGYLAAHLSKGGISMSVKIHKIVFESFCGPRKKGMQLNHKDGDKKNNRIDNIECVTMVENIQHRIKILGINLNGSKNYNAKLKEKDIPKIIKLHSQGMSAAKIGKIFGVSYAPIYRIIHRRGWLHCCPLTGKSE